MPAGVETRSLAVLSDSRLGTLELIDNSQRLQMDMLSFHKLYSNYSGGNIVIFHRLNRSPSHSYMLGSNDRRSMPHYFA